MANTINDEFMQQVATEEAWKKLSEEFPWSETLLDKYADNVDWNRISSNRYIRWTVPMLKKFSRSLDWKEVSRIIDDEWFTPAHIEAFKDKWDWAELCDRYPLSERLIDQYIDYIDWAAMIGAPGHFINDLLFKDGFDAIAFYEKYKQHIPMQDFQNSYLWACIIDQRANDLTIEIMS